MEWGMYWMFIYNIGLGKQPRPEFDVALSYSQVIIRKERLVHTSKLVTQE